MNDVLLTPTEIVTLTTPVLAALPDSERAEAEASLAALLCEATNIAMQIAVIGSWTADRNRSLFERIYQEGR